MYFSSFPTANFNGTELLDLTRRFDLTKVADQSPLTYMNYSVQEGETPEDIAFYYYDDPSYAWLVLLSNNIIDPYTDWPKSSSEFEEYIKSEYASESGTTGDAVIEWSKNTSLSGNIVHYQNLHFKDVQITRSSWYYLYHTQLNTPNITAGETISNTIDSEYNQDPMTQDYIKLNWRASYYPVRVYDYELQLNESRREIQLLNKSLLPQIKEQIETILNDK